MSARQLLDLTRLAAWAAEVLFLVCVLTSVVLLIAMRTNPGTALESVAAVFSIANLVLLVFSRWLRDLESRMERQ